MTGEHQLRAGESLRRQSLTSRNDAFTLKHFGHDDLILFRNHDRKPLWWSSTVRPNQWRRKKHSEGNSAVTLQEDGDLVARDEHGDPLWSTGTAGRGAVLLEVRDDGEIALLCSSGETVWHTGTAREPAVPPPFAVARGDRMLVGQSLADQSLTSANGRFVLVHDHQHAGTFLYGPYGRMSNWCYLVPLRHPVPFDTRLVLDEDGPFLHWRNDDLRDVRMPWGDPESPWVPCTPEQLVLRDNGDVEILEAGREVIWRNGYKYSHPNFARSSNGPAPHV